MNKNQIGPLGLQHVDEVFELLRVIYEKQPQKMPMGGQWSRSLVLHEIEGGQAIGLFDATSRVRSVILFRDQARALEVSFLGTHPKFRCRGHMEILLKQLKTQLSEGQELWIDVHEKNQVALDYYHSRGFKRVGERKAYYADGGNALLYSYGLN